jgi:hypothetical protein
MCCGWMPCPCCAYCWSMVSPPPDNNINQLSLSHFMNELFNEIFSTAQNM